MSKPAVKTGRQAEKSEQTRTSIMEATMDCLINDGYKNTTTTRIADTAGVSRGAMMHHFEDRLDIIKAAINYLVDKRLQEFHELMNVSVSATDEVSSINEESLRQTINALWDFFHLPSYIAFQELLIAARTDKDLAKLIYPAQQEFDNRITSSIRDMFPVWKDYEGTQEVLTDLYFFTLQGIALQQTVQKDQKRVKNLLDLLVEHALLEFQKSTGNSA